MTGKSSGRPRAAAVIGQALLYAALAGVVAVFSRWPVYHQLEADQALIKLSIVHETEHAEACRQRTPEELERLPPNMRAPLSCPRERAPLVVEVDLDGRPAIRRVAQPSGLSRDGRALLYERLVTNAGTHHIAVRLRDGPGEGFRHRREADVTIKPAQVLVIDFEPARREITFR